MHIFSPLMESKGQPFFGASDTNSGYGNGAEQGFESCFSHCLASDDRAARDDRTAASSAQEKTSEPAEPDANRENFSQVTEQNRDRINEDGAETSTTDEEGQHAASKSDRLDEDASEKVSEAAGGNEESVHDARSRSEKDAILQTVMQLLALLAEKGGSNPAELAGNSGSAMLKDQGLDAMIQRLKSLLGKNEGAATQGQSDASSAAGRGGLSTGELLADEDVLKTLRAVLEKMDADGASGARILSQLKSAGLTSEEIAALREMVARALDRFAKSSGGENLASGDSSGSRAGELVSSTTDQNPGANGFRAEQAANRAEGSDQWGGLRRVLNEKSVAQPGSGEAASRTSGESAESQRVAAMQHVQDATEEQQSGETSRLVHARDGEKGDGRLLSRDSEQFKDMMESKDKDGKASAGNKGQTAQAGENNARSETMFSRAILDSDLRGEGVSTERGKVSRDILDQIQRGAFNNLGQGKKQLTLQLNPAHLGAVNVVLQVRGKDVNAILKTSQEDTSRILGEQMVQLKEHLEKQGLRVVKLEVQNQMPSHDRPNQWNGGSEHNQSQEQFEANMRELRWRSLRGEGDGLAREMHIPDHGVNISPKGIDFFA